jgi:PhnB protein
MSKEDPGPPGVIAYVTSPNANKHIEWLVTALGAEVLDKRPFYDNPKKVMHCALKINGGTMYLADSMQDHIDNAKGADELVTLHINAADSQAVWDKALKHGAKSLMNLDIAPWGAKYGTFADPYGFQWSLNEFIEAPPAEAEPKSPKKRTASASPTRKGNSPSPKRQKKDD